MKKYFIPAFFILCLVALLMIQFWPNNKPTNQIAQQQKQTSNKNAFIASGLKPEGSYYLPDLTPIAKDIDSLDLLATVIINKDINGLQSLEHQGKIFITDGSTNIKYIKDVDNKMIGINKPIGLIQVGSGKHIGQTGYIFTKQVQ